MLKNSLLAAASVCVLGMAMDSGALRAADPNAALVEQVRSAESAFARSMAERDLKAFGSLVAADAVFIGGSEVLRGRDAVVAGWKRYFEAPAAPFSWSPQQVEVLAGGTLAFSTGPVLNAQGERIGNYKSTWRRDRDGRWRVAIDSGCPACNCSTATAPGGTAGGGAGP